MYNFTDILESFLLRDACIQASSDKEIGLSLKSILTDNDQHGKINALNALEVVKENKGSSDAQARKERKQRMNKAVMESVMKEQGNVCFAPPKSDRDVSARSWKKRAMKKYPHFYK